MFCALQELVDIHRSFLEKLREATQPQSRTRLSSIFIEFREKFLIYGDYCSKMTDATDTLRDTMKRSVAVEQMVVVSDSSCYQSVRFSSPILCQ
jgi:guanine nucleotide exchange factor VAV